MIGNIKSCARTIWFGSAILFGTILFTATSAFADQIYLNIAGISGNSTDSAHPGWITIKSFSMNKNTVTITKEIDKSSSALFSAATAGKLLSIATIDDIDSDGHHSTITMHNVIIKGVNNGASSSVPIQEITLEFASFSRKR